MSPSNSQFEEERVITEARGIIVTLLSRAKRNKLISILLQSLANGILAGVLISLVQQEIKVTILTLLVLFITSMWFLMRKTDYKELNENSVVEHINCNFSEFEESSQLILKQKQDSVLQKIQAKKIEALLLNQEMQGKINESLRGVIYKPTIILLTVSLALYASYLLITKIEFIRPAEQSTSQVEQNSKIKFQPQIAHAEVSINPPQYTGLTKTTQSELNLKIIEGSKVNWKFNFSEDNADYFFINAEGKKHQILATDNGDFLYSEQFFQTGLYRIIFEKNGLSESVGEVYTIEVKPDRAAQIKIITPKQSLVEIAKNSDASFDLIVEVSDDFGVFSAKIIASVASGSGEAVKFRDEVFSFDKREVKDSKLQYKKHWNLKQLKMEPGDEVYFKVLVEDNKQPEHQLSKSSSVIVRWLDEETTELAAGGIRINFIAEYFRSQRQIIIETEQLISDRTDLSTEMIDQISRDLGYSQSDLKTKYGQYLGDEIGDRPGEQFGLADGTHTDHKGEDNSSAEDTHELDEENDIDGEQHTGEPPEAGHLHEEMVDSSDASGRSELIARFAHNHGTTEIGPMSKQDPKSWMKKAVSEMWQAELHLMLSQPELALEFEYKAYDYLKLANQAERVYVKRLGFEPPPVNEDNRLSGELKDILNYSLSVSDSPDQHLDEILFQRMFSLLSENSTISLPETDISLIKQLKKRFLQLSEKRPALIQQAATIERILTENTTQLQNCNDCAEKLKQKLWQLMPQPMSKPMLRRTAVLPEGNNYQQKIKFLKNKSSSNGVEND